MTSSLSRSDLELLADLVADRIVARLDPPAPPAASERLVTAAELAQLLGVSPATVRANAARYGARRIGDGPRPRLRFDPAVALAADRPEPEARPVRATPRRPRRSRPAGPSVPLLPIGGQEAQR